MVNREDLNDLLEKMPAWKRMAGASERMDALEARIHALEAQVAGGLQSRSDSGDTCPFCNTRSGHIYRIEKDLIFGDIGGRMGYFECDACNKGYCKPYMA